jgi:hypothetical protein
MYRKHLFFIISLQKHNPPLIQEEEEGGVEGREDEESGGEEANGSPPPTRPAHTPPLPPPSPSRAAAASGTARRGRRRGERAAAEQGRAGRWRRKSEAAGKRADLSSSASSVSSSYPVLPRIGQSHEVSRNYIEAPVIFTDRNWSKPHCFFLIYLKLDELIWFSKKVLLRKLTFLSTVDSNLNSHKP